MSLPKFISDDQTLTMLQTRWTAIIDPVVDNVTANLTASSFQRYNTSNGYGSVFTIGRRIENKISATGSDITVNQSSAFGTSVVINTPGVYAVSYTDQFNAMTDMTISLNYATGGIAIVLIPASKKLVTGTTSGTDTCMTLSWCGQLAANDVLRFLGDLSPSGAQPGNAQFTVTFLGIKV